MKKPWYFKAPALVWGALATLVWLGVDAYVSLSALQWPGTIRLLVGKAGAPGSEYRESATHLLIVLAWMMYLLLGWTVTRIMVLRRQMWQMGWPREEELQKLQEHLEDWFSPAGPMDGSRPRVEDPNGNTKVAVWRAGQRDQVLGSYSGIIRTCLALLGTRHFTDYEGLAHGFHASIEHMSRNARTTAARIGSLGDLAATFGLFGTVIGLIAGGNDLTNPDLVGNVLQAALIKTATGFLAKALCLWQSSLAYHTLDELEAMLRTIAGRALSCGDEPARGSSRSGLERGES